MTTIKFVEASGREVVTTVDRETTLMELAVAHNIEGVLAECGGACVCATCHCYLEENHSESLGEPAPMELMMLDEVLNLKESSRLACQVDITSDLDGLVVTIPPLA
jgi:2Fe-2S ferredoxin